MSWSPTCMSAPPACAASGGHALSKDIGSDRSAEDHCCPAAHGQCCPAACTNRVPLLHCPAAHKHAPLSLLRPLYPRGEPCPPAAHGWPPHARPAPPGACTQPGKAANSSARGGWGWYSETPIPRFSLQCSVLGLTARLQRGSAVSASRRWAYSTHRGVSPPRATLAGLAPAASSAFTTLTCPCCAACTQRPMCRRQRQRPGAGQAQVWRPTLARATAKTGCPELRPLLSQPLAVASRLAAEARFQEGRRAGRAHRVERRE